MLFPLRLDFSDSKTGAALAGAYTFDMTREFHIAQIFLEVSFTVATAAATINADGLLGLVKRVVLTVADGARTRNVIDCSAAGLVEFYHNINGMLDKDTLSALGVAASGTAPNTTGAKILHIPIWFCPPNLDDPVNSMLLLPAPRFTSNPQLSVTFGSQTDVDVNATPTFALTGTITARLVIQRRSVLVKSWPTFDAELQEITVPYPNSGKQAYELQSPGSYTGILLRAYTSSSVRGDVMTAGGEFNLQLLGTQIRRFRLTDLEFINYYSKSPQFAIGAAGSVVGVSLGAYFMDFISDSNGQAGGELGSVLDANLPVTTGARLRLVQDITGGATVQIKYVAHRIFGILDNLKMLTKLGAKPKS
jgi:hypothetical protein